MMDKNLLRKIMDAPSKTPIVSLYLELGCIPVRYMIKYKRIMYLHHILHLGEDHLVSKVFSAQKADPTKGDWCIQVNDDLKELGLEYLSSDDIRSMTKYKFKKIVKKALTRTVLQYLESLKRTKSAKIESDNLNIQPYLKSESLSLNDKKLLFKLRSRMVPVSSNFGGKDSCKFCQIEISSQEHLLDCLFLKSQNSNVLFNPIQHDDIYSDSIQKMKNAAFIFKEAIRMIEILLETGQST